MVRLALGCKVQAEHIVSSIPKRVHTSENTCVLVLLHIFSQVQIHENMYLSLSFHIRF